MVDGVRILESSVDTRVSESGDTRVTENFFEGFVSLAAAASIAAAATFTSQAEASLSSTGSKVFAGIGEFQGLLTSSASSSLVTDPSVILYSESSLSGDSSCVSTPSVNRKGESSALGDSSILVVPSKFMPGVSSFSAESTFSSVAVRDLVAFFESFVEEATRITELEDVRITESGDVRITDELLFNTGQADLVGIPSKILFNGVPYYKEDGEWKRFEPYVKYEGVWKEPVAVYKKIDGSWKRIY